MKKSALGFTLIELLIVITIIAVLSAIGLVVYSSVQKQARTAKRLEDLKAVKTALELYYAKNGSYPVSTAGCTDGSSCLWRSECTGWTVATSDQVILGLVPQYLVAMPKDPQMDTANNKSCYLYKSNGTDYKFLDYRITDFYDGASAFSAQYFTQRNLVDPNRDKGTDLTTVDGTTAESWAIWTNDAISW